MITIILLKTTKIMLLNRFPPLLISNIMEILMAVGTNIALKVLILKLTVVLIVSKKNKISLVIL